MGDETPWHAMSNEAPQAPEPATTGTKRDFGNMLNEKLSTKIKKPKKQSTHWELPKKLKLNGI